VFWVPLEREVSGRFSKNDLVLGKPGFFGTLDRLQGRLSLQGLAEVLGWACAGSPKQNGAIEVVSVRGDPHLGCHCGPWPSSPQHFLRWLSQSRRGENYFFCILSLLFRSLDCDCGCPCLCSILRPIWNFCLGHVGRS
jgi:hypothetical protein